MSDHATGIADGYVEQIMYWIQVHTPSRQPVEDELKMGGGEGRFRMKSTLYSPMIRLSVIQKVM